MLRFIRALRRPQQNPRLSRIVSVTDLRTGSRFSVTTHVILRDERGKLASSKPVEGRAAQEHLPEGHQRGRAMRLEIKLERDGTYTLMKDGEVWEKYYVDTQAALAKVVQALDESEDKIGQAYRDLDKAKQEHSKLFFAFRRLRREIVNTPA